MLGRSTPRRALTVLAMVGTLAAVLPGSAMAAPGVPRAARPAGGSAVASARPARTDAAAHTRSSAIEMDPAGQVPVRRACPQPTSPDQAACQALVRTGAAVREGRRLGTDATPLGYGPSDLRSAYSLPSATAGAGATVAVVDAYDDPSAASDLAVYRKQYGLPACTTASGCFRKVNQNGGTDYPVPDAGWAEEMSLDLDMVSAICPNCHILLVEANSNSDSNLAAAESTAVALGARYVSNSWSGCAWNHRFDAHFDHPGVVITAAAGDYGYDNWESSQCASYPAGSRYVVSVGGTTLTRDRSSTRGWAETVWSGSGSDCAVGEPKPSWQKDDPGCPYRTSNDVAAVGDPATGVAVYDTFGTDGWAVFGGTSVATPIIASVYALAGQPAGGTYPASYLYRHAADLNDITSGRNYPGPGNCLGEATYLCAARKGYDGPTGLGTPEGVAAFQAGPHGTVTGTVTSAGQPVAGAQVMIGKAVAVTNSAGQYSTTALDGTYAADARKYGYDSQSVPGVTVSSGGTTQQNFTLTQQPVATVTGTVTDASGQGWPLYAQVRVPGTPATSYTSPVTGRYTLTLPVTGKPYKLDTSALYPGYAAASTAITPVAGGLAQNVGLTVDTQSCRAPGYRLSGTGTCAPVTGGLVAGQVLDANTGQPVNGATVAEGSHHVRTVPEPDDPAVGGGLYWMFSHATGAQTVTASGRGYTTASDQVTVTSGAVTQAGFKLDAGELTANPASVTGTAQMGSGSATAKLTVTNTGTAPATLQLNAQQGPFTLTGGVRSGAAAPRPMQVKGPFSPVIPAAGRLRPRAAPASATGPAPQQWTQISHYPDDVYDNAAATDPATGDVYSVGGLGLASAFEYRPATGTWTRLPDMRYQRAAAVAAVIGGKLYVTGGYDESELNPNLEQIVRPALEVYDPLTGQWAMGAPIPHATFGSATAVLDGKMYVVGGCTLNPVNRAIYECTSRRVEVYDPASNTWTQAAQYPARIAYLGCGTISGKLYCAGGYDQATGGAVTAAYSYDPASNTWSPIASLPAGLWGSDYAGANGQLLMSGGVTGLTGPDEYVTNRGYAYSPESNAWIPLPPSGEPTYLGGSACGLYRIGGLYPHDGSYYYGASAEQLPGYGECDGGAGVPWLKISPAGATLAPGQSTTITLTMNAADPSITQPGGYTATLQLDGNTPYVPQQAGVTLTASPPSAWGGLAGTVRGRACGGKTAPLAGATVQVDSKAGSWTLTADRHGHYGIWLDRTASPLTLIVTAPGWLAQTRTARITAGKTSTVSFTLSRSSCG